MRVILIHINRTGGTSLASALNLQPTHFCLRTAQAFLGMEELEEGKVVTFIRNPYDRMVSIYEYRKKHDTHGIRSQEITFDKFCRLTLVRRAGPYYNRALMFRSQTHWLLDLEENLYPVDFLGRFEDYHRDVCRLLEILGRDIPENLPHLKKTDHPHWSTYYRNPRTQEIVLEAFEEDFENFAYPTKITEPDYA